jgi:hypothetical protein
MIRMEGAYELCTALNSCATLVHVDMSFNALGKESGIALGNSVILMPVKNTFDPPVAFNTINHFSLSLYIYAALEGALGGEQRH